MAVVVKEWKDRSGSIYPLLTASGPDLTEAFCEAARGFFDLFTDRSTIRPRVEVEIFCESSDTEWLFSDWINTMIYEIRERQMLFSEFEVYAEGINVKGVIRGEAIDPDRHPRTREFIAGAAFDGLAVDESPGEVRVSVVLNDRERHPLPLAALWHGKGLV